MRRKNMRMSWNRLGPMFASDIPRQRISLTRSFRPWRWHLNEMYVTQRAAQPS